MREAAKRESAFLSELHLCEHPTIERLWRLEEDLGYFSELLNREVWIRAGFWTDLASVPRVPVVYTLWGDRAHREAVVHDYLYRVGCDPEVSRYTANRVFFEAMLARRKPAWVRHPMFWGVFFGFSSFRRRGVGWTPENAVCATG